MATGPAPANRDRFELSGHLTWIVGLVPLCPGSGTSPANPPPMLAKPSLPLETQYNLTKSSYGKGAITRAEAVARARRRSWTNSLNDMDCRNCSVCQRGARISGGNATTLPRLRSDNANIARVSELQHAVEDMQPRFLAMH